MYSQYLPKSVAIIPDGNRRWAKLHKFRLVTGYDIGINKAIDVSIWLSKLKIKSLSIWALSTENIKNRNKDELKLLYRLYKSTALDQKVLDKLKKHDAKVIIIGNLKLLPKDVRDALKKLEYATKDHKSTIINLLIGYGGQEDILFAAKKMLSDKLKNKIKTINQKVFQSYLRSASLMNPDLIIRTSGEMRLSGFLPWQSTYSELYFINKYWPEFNESDLKTAIKDYAKRHRRYGK